MSILEKIRDWRSSELGFSDLLFWDLLVADGVLLCKDGTLLAGFYFEGPDTAVMSAVELDHLADRMNNALASLGGEFILHIDASRIESKHYPAESESAFPDPVSAKIDAERRTYFSQAGDHFETVHSVCIGYLPALQTKSKMAGWLVTRDLDSEIQQRLDVELQKFEQALGDFEDRLSSVLHLQRMRAFVTRNLEGERRYCELLGHLRWCLTGEQVPVLVPKTALSVDSLFAPQEFYTGITPKMNDDFISVVAIDGLPGETHSQILGYLSRLPSVYRFSTRFIGIDRPKAEAELHAHRRKWQSKERGLLDQMVNPTPSASSAIDQHAVGMVHEIDTSLSEQSAGVLRFGRYSANVVLRGPDRDRVGQSAREIRRVLLNGGFNARVETLNTVEAFLGTLPGDAVRNVRRPLLNSLHVANLLPLSSEWAGDANAPSPPFSVDAPPLAICNTRGGAAFRLNLHVRDVGHTLMFGPTGAGKSTALGLLAAQFLRYPNARVIAFDKGHSLETLCRAVGGDHRQIDPEKSSFAPLAGLSGAADLQWAAEWTEMLVQLQGVSLTTRQRELLFEALQQTLQSEKPCITTLAINVQDQDLKAALNRYGTSGPFGLLIDSDDPDEADRSRFFQCWEVGALLDGGAEALIALPVLLHLFHQVERTLDGSPTLIVIDEAWAMLGHELFRDKIREWLKTLRKANTSVVMATQSLSDATRSQILDVLVESCATTFCLANPQADLGDSPALYRTLGFSDTEIQVIKSLTPKREYYVTSAAGSRIIDLALGPTALAAVGVSSPEDLIRVRRLAESGKPNEEWFEEWLQLQRTGD